MYSNIIRLPERDIKNNEIYKNYWILYEESYKNNVNLNNFDFDKINTFNNFANSIDYINNIKYNFYQYDDIKVSESLITKFLIGYLKKNDSLIENEINIFMTTGKFTDFTVLFLNCNLKCNCFFLKNYTDCIIDYMNKIDTSKYLDFIKFKFILDRLINKIIEIDEEDKMLSLFINLISDKLTDILLVNIKMKGLSIFSDFFDKKYLLNVFNNKTIFNFFSDDAKQRFNNDLICFFKIKLNNENSYNNNLAKQYYHLIRILNIKSVYIENKICTNIPYNDITNYICASMFYWLNKEHINIVFEYIKFHKNIFPNKIEFLNFYKYHLQRRATYKLNHEYENKAFEKMRIYFNDDIYCKYLDNIKNCLDDIYLSDYMNSEINNLNISTKTNDYKDIEYDIKKLDVFISSTILWQDIYKNINTNINLSKNIDIYLLIIKNYYTAKYIKRIFHISYDDSFIDITLGTANVRLPLSYYCVLENIGNNDNITLEKLERNTNIQTENLKTIINIMKSNNLIFEKNCKLNFCKGILTKNIEINLTQDIKVNNKLVENEINYDKDQLIDALVVRVCKKNQTISYGRLIMILRSELSKMFIPYETNIKKRLSKLEELGYISINKLDNIYTYIP